MIIVIIVLISKIAHLSWQQCIKPMCFWTKMISWLFWHYCCSHIGLSAIRYSFKLSLPYLWPHYPLEMLMLVNKFNVLIALSTRIEILALFAMIFDIFYGLNLAYITLISKKSIFIAIFIAFVFFLFVFLFWFRRLWYITTEALLLQDWRRS